MSEAKLTEEDKKEKKSNKSYKLTKETKEKVRSICDEVGLQTDEVFNMLIEAYKEQQFLKKNQNRAASITDLQSHLTAINKAFEESIEYANNDETRIRQKYENRIVMAETATKAQAAQIKDLEESKKRISVELVEAQQKVCELQELVDTLKAAAKQTTFYKLESGKIVNLTKFTEIQIDQNAIIGYIEIAPNQTTKQVIYSGEDIEAEIEKINIKLDL